MDELPQQLNRSVSDDASLSNHSLIIPSNQHKLLGQTSDRLSSHSPDTARCSIEEALEKVGYAGTYQTRIILIFIAQWMISVFVFVGPSYYFPDPVFICADGETCNESNGGCIDQILQPSEYTTITSDFKLYCDHQSDRSIAQSALFWGPIFGNILFSFFADWIGRRTTLIIAWVLATIGISGIAVSQEPYQLIVAILLTGFSLVPCNSLNLIMVNEQCDDSLRQRGTTYLLMSWALFAMVLVPIAKYVKDWRDIFIYFMAFPSIAIAILTFLFVYESPRFLLTKNREKDLLYTLNRIADTNNNPRVTESYVASITLQPGESSVSTANSVEQQKNKKVYTYFDLIRYPSLRQITIASCIVMFFTQMIYYATQFSLDSIGEDLYINALVVSAGEAIAYFICNRFIHKVRRKLYTFIFFTTSILLCTLFMFITSSIAQTFLTAFVRIFNCGTLGILALFVEELYPTTVRSLGVGAQMSIGVAGSSLAPIIINQAKRMGINPLVATAVLAIPGIFTVTFFVETKGTPLSDDVIEIKQKQ